MGWLSRLFNEHKAARRAVLIWSMTMGTIVILRATDDMSLVTASVSALVSTVLGLLTVPIAYYFKSRGDGK